LLSFVHPTAAQITTTRASLVTLQDELDAAKQRRRELEEYESLAKRVHALPSRTDSASQIVKLKDTELTLHADRAALIADLRVKQSKYKDVLASMELMSSEWTSEEAVDALAAALQKRAAEAEEALERQRALEEAALNDAALEAKLSAQADAEPEPEPEHEREGGEEEEKKDQDAHMEEGETTAADTPNETSVAQIPDGGEATPTVQLPTGDATRPPTPSLAAQSSEGSGTGTPVPLTPVASPAHAEAGGSETPTPMDTQQ
jgi:hypothetical protein